MNRKNLLIRYDKALRLRMMYPETRKEITRDVVRFVRNTPGINFVGFTFANEPELERVIDQQVEYFVPMQQPFTWKVYDHDLLPSLGDKLLARQFVVDDQPADVMVLELKNASLHLFESGNGNIRRIPTSDELKDIVNVLKNVYGSQSTRVHEQLGTHLKIPGYLSVYAAYINDQPTALAWTYFPNGPFAILSAESTITEYRNQEFYADLLSRRLREIRERGYSYAVVETGPTSKPIIEKSGFNHLTTAYSYEWKGN